MAIDVGDKVPDFNLPADGGGRITAAGLRGRKLVLYFYPKDDTPGCTREAQAFRDLAGAFAEAGAAIVGVSKDSVRSHDKFKAKYDLNFALAADIDGTLCEAMGVWVEKSMYGRSYFGIDRATFLIDGAGVVRQVWRKVKVPGHAEAVLAATKSL